VRRLLGVPRSCNASATMITTTTTSTAIVQRADLLIESR
jgi:hypothetical protein